MRRFIIITFIVLGLLFFGFTFFDYQTSELLYREDGLIGRLTREYIYIPIYLVALFFTLVLIYSSPIKKGPFKKVFQVLFIIAYGVILFGYASILYRETNGNLIWILLSLPILIIGSFLFNALIPNEERHQYEIPALIYLPVLLVMNLTVNGLKVIIDRMRYLAVDEVNDFTYWFSPSGFFTFSHDYNSFPSGHVGSVAVLMGIVLIPLMVTRFKPYLKHAIVFSSMIILLTALGRVMDGKHYVTDVVFSIALVLGLYVVFWKVNLHHWLKTLFEPKTS